MNYIKILFYYFLLCTSISLYGAAGATFDLQEVKRELPIVIPELRRFVKSSTNPLIKAAATVDMKKFDEFVRIQGINASDENGITPLIAAIISGQSRMVFHALLYEADPCGRIDGYSPFLIVQNCLQREESAGWKGRKGLIEYAIDIKHIQKGCKKCGVEAAPLYDPDTEKFDF